MVAILKARSIQATVHCLRAASHVVKEVTLVVTLVGVTFVGFLDTL
jgi:hypothetical protein